MLYAGTYTGTVHTYCPEFDNKDPITFTISRSGVIDIFNYDMVDGNISASGVVSGIGITVYSRSLGKLTINYAATTDGTSFQGSGQSVNGIISTITATRTVPTYQARYDSATVTEDSGAAATGNLIDNDNDPLALVTAVKGKAVAASGTTTVTGTYGTLTIAADGSYSYALNNANPTVNALKDGSSLYDSFTYKAGNAASTDEATLYITIDGRTDPKVPVNGTSGNDILLNTGVAEIFNGGKGSDTVSYARAKAGVTADLASPSNNSGAAEDDAYISIENLTGSAFYDKLTGDANANILDGAGGSDWLRGGAGNDTYIVDNRYDYCSETRTGGIDLVVSSVSYELGWYSYVENLTLSGKVSINATGNELANTLTGNRGHNILDGGQGADKLYGGLGNDTYIVDNVADHVFEKVGEGKDTVRASVSYVLAAGQEVETLELSPYSGNINLTGNNFANTLRDNGGNNRLDGGAGDDLLISLRGQDILVGGGGNDSAVIDRSGSYNTLSFVMTSVNAVTTLVGDGTTTTKIGNITLTGGTGNDTFKTSNGTDVLNGGAGADLLDSGGGDDTLDGGTGIDRLVGGSGNDTYRVDDAGDLVVEARGGGTDKVVTSVSYGLQAGQEIEVLELFGTTGRVLTGNEFDQTLIGNKLANTLDSQFGNDRLIGGGGADAFVFSTALGAKNVDHIADFATVDTIRLSKSVFLALAPGQLAEGAFKNLSTGAADADDRILYNQKTGDLFYDADGSGSAAGIKFAVLDNKAAITHADFFIV